MKIEENVNMYELFALMFCHLTKEVEKEFSDKGIEAIRRGVQNFGEERGRNIAQKTEKNGNDNSAEYYLSTYDMDRSELFQSDDKVEGNVVEQTFNKCVFAEVFSKYGLEEYGIHYCEIIDGAIAKGYNPCFNCTHDKHFFKDGKCHFIFEMSEENK